MTLGNASHGQPGLGKALVYRWAQDVCSPGCFWECWQLARTSLMLGSGWGQVWAGLKGQTFFELFLLQVMPLQGQQKRRNRGSLPSRAHTRRDMLTIGKMGHQTA